MSCVVHTLAPTRATCSSGEPNLLAAAHTRLLSHVQSSTARGCVSLPHMRTHGTCGGACIGPMELAGRTERKGDESPGARLFPVTFAVGSHPLAHPHRRRSSVQPPRRRQRQRAVLAVSSSSSSSSSSSQSAAAEQQQRFRFPDGSSYVGETSDGRLCGTGQWQSGTGERYVGQFKDDVFDGQGSYTDMDGNTYSGPFVGGAFHGVGTYVYADGRAEVGEYDAGACVCGFVVVWVCGWVGVDVGE
jgi:hypothetical protein